MDIINELLPHNSKRREVAKKLVKPPLKLLLPIINLRIFGKKVFINRYTKALPLVGNVLAWYEVRLMMLHTAMLRQKEYYKWLETHKPTQEDLKQQTKSAKQFEHQPKISIIVPTYNTDIEFLKQCLDSVLDQTYQNWQLCIADDASTKEKVREVIGEYARKDERIDCVFREENGHICQASNSALELAEGDYIALLDHDDILWPNALFEVVKALNQDPCPEFVYTDEDKVDELGENHGEPFLKPDWSPEYLRSVNYITHFAVIKKDLVEQVGGFRPGYEGAQDWDLFLRVSRKTDQIHHIPKILYSWRKSETSTAQTASVKDYAYDNQKKALADDVEQRGFEAEIEWRVPYLMWRTTYQLQINPKISIVIPTKDNRDYIRTCLDSIEKKTRYQNYETVVVDTGTTDEEVWRLYQKYENRGLDFRVVEWDKPFNFAAVCNFGAAWANGDYFLFLNNDTQVITEGWLKKFLEYGQMEEIGAIGCRLLYPNGSLQHAGVVLGIGGLDGTPGIAAHLFPAYFDNPPQDPVLPLYAGGTRNFSAVTAACLMVEKEKFQAVGGFDPEFEIAFNDVDFCLKLLDQGWRNVYLPHVSLYHHESISVGKLDSQQRDTEVFSKEIQKMLSKWPDLLEDDPYYHPEFRRDVASARLNVKLSEEE